MVFWDKNFFRKFKRSQGRSCYLITLLLEQRKNREENSFVDYDTYH